MGKKTISLCMIVKDEEAYLRRCLDSVKNHVDEIIIVDTGSTDSTKIIAEEFGTRIFTYKWDKDFAAARNFSIEKAQSDYVLVIDADEYLDENTDLQKEISEQKDFYIINFKNYMDGGYVTKHQAIRLFKNKKNLKYHGKIHEHLNIDDFENLTSAFAGFVIHHDGYKKETFSKKDKFDRNLGILEKEVKNNPTGYNLFNLGTQFKVAGEYLKALDHFRKSYPLSKNQIYVPYLLYSMGDCLLQLGRNKEGINLMKDSIELFPKYTGFYYLLGLYYENLNYFKAAEESFEKCLELGEVEHFQSIEGVGSYFAYIKLSEIQQKQGNLLKALDSAFTALEINKKFPPALSQYFTVLKSAGINENDIKENFKRTYPISNLKELEILVGVLYAHRNKLLQYYIGEYNIKVNSSVLAISALYNKKYEEACSFWKREEKINENNYSDIYTLLMVQFDEELLVKLLNNMNLNKNERKVLVSLLKHSDEVSMSLPESLVEILISACLNLLRIAEEKKFLYLYNKLSFIDHKKVELIKLLLNNGYLKIVENLITEELKINSKPNDLMGLLADVYTRQNKFEDAFSLYMQLIESVGDYSSYNRLYNLYNKIGYSDGLPLLEMKMGNFLKNELGISNNFS